MKDFLKKNFSILIRRIFLSLPLGLRDYILLFLCRKMIKPYKKASPSDSEGDKMNVLVLNGERFPQDLDALNETKAIRLYLLPVSLQSLINSIFLPTTQSFTIKYYLDKSQEVEDLVTSLNRVLESIRTNLKIDSVLTCAFYYRQDFPYQESCKRIGLSYNVLFREYMKDEVISDKTAERYFENGFKFYGDNLFLANEKLKEIILKSQVCSEEQIKIVGSPRFDTIFKKSKESEKPESKKNVTLFSFLHAAGGVQLSNPLFFFTSNPEEGFFHLFQDVHKSFAELAIKNPDYNFIIKTKYAAGGWFKNIINTINSNCERNIEEIPNLKLQSKGDSQELIRKSKCVIAFNSTTVLETLLEGTALVIPLFNEAASKYKDTNVFFQNSLSSLPVVKSEEELKSRVGDYLRDKEYAYKCPERMINDFLYKFDGKSSDRMIKELNLIRQS